MGMRTLKETIPLLLFDANLNQTITIVKVSFILKLSSLQSSKTRLNELQITHVLDLDQRVPIGGLRTIHFCFMDTYFEKQNLNRLYYVLFCGSLTTNFQLSNFQLSIFRRLIGSISGRPI